MDKAFVTMMSGLSGMIGWGTADFFAGSTIKKIGYKKTFFWVQVFGLLVNLAVLAVQMPGSLNFHQGFLFYTIIAAIAYWVGYEMLYLAFSKGNISIVSPLASTSVIFTVVIALTLMGQQITSLQALAIGIVIVGVMLASIDFSSLTSGKVSITAGVKEAVAHSLLFGALFWPMNEFITERTGWVAFNSLVKVLALVFFMSHMFLSHSPIKLQAIPSGSWKFLVLIGILDVLGVLGVGYGIHRADSALIIPVSSAASVVTILLAIVFRREKLTFTQAVGVAFTVAGIILVNSQ